MLIECILGQAETTVGSSNYAFNRDEHGRFVAEVANATHVACFLGAGTYRIAEAIEAAPQIDTGDETPEPTDGEDDGAEEAITPPNAADKPKRGRRKS